MSVYFYCSTHRAQCNAVKRFPSWLLKRLFSSKMCKHPSRPTDTNGQMIISNFVKKWQYSILPTPSVLTERNDSKAKIIVWMKLLIREKCSFIHVFAMFICILVHVRAKIGPRKSGPTLHEPTVSVQARPEPEPRQQFCAEARLKTRISTTFFIRASKLNTQPIHN